jgi:DNA-binding IclR family transcriptional regulator
LYVERVTGHRSVSVKSRRGGRLPLHATGVGKVLLAHAPEAVQEEVLAEPLKRFTPYTVVAPGLLRQILRDVRRTGVAFAREEMTVGRTSIAVPVRDRTGTAVAAMSIVLPATGSPIDRLEVALRTAARGASRRLGEYRPVPGAASYLPDPSPGPARESDSIPHSH